MTIEQNGIIMTPQLQKEIAGIKSLSAHEQRQLLQILSATVNKYDDNICDLKLVFHVSQNVLLKPRDLYPLNLMVNPDNAP